MITDTFELSTMSYVESYNDGCVIGLDVSVTHHLKGDKLTLAIFTYNTW